MIRLLNSRNIKLASKLTRVHRKPYLFKQPLISQPIVIIPTSGYKVLKSEDEEDFPMDEYDDPPIIYN